MSNVESICGEYPTDFVKTDIASDPSYVFVNDPNYSAKAFRLRRINRIRKLIY